MSGEPPVCPDCNEPIIGAAHWHSPPRPTTEEARPTDCPTCGAPAASSVGGEWVSRWFGTIEARHEIEHDGLLRDCDNPGCRSYMQAAFAALPPEQGKPPTDEWAALDRALLVTYGSPQGTNATAIMHRLAQDGYEVRAAPPPEQGESPAEPLNTILQAIVQHASDAGMSFDDLRVLARLIEKAELAAWAPAAPQPPLDVLRDALLSLAWNEKDGPCWCPHNPSGGYVRSHGTKCKSIRAALSGAPAQEPTPPPSARPDRPAPASD